MVGTLPRRLGQHDLCSGHLCHEDRSVRGRGQYLDPRAWRMTLDTRADTWLDRSGKRAALGAGTAIVSPPSFPPRRALRWPPSPPTQVHGAVDTRCRPAVASTVARDFSTHRGFERCGRCLPHRAVAG